MYYSTVWIRSSEPLNVIAKQLDEIARGELIGTDRVVIRDCLREDMPVVMAPIYSVDAVKALPELRKVFGEKAVRVCTAETEDGAATEGGQTDTATLRRLRQMSGTVELLKHELEKLIAEIETR